MSWEVATVLVPLFSMVGLYIVSSFIVPEMPEDSKSKRFDWFALLCLKQLIFIFCLAHIPVLFIMGGDVVTANVYAINSTSVSSELTGFFSTGVIASSMLILAYFVLSAYTLFNIFTDYIKILED